MATAASLGSTKPVEAACNTASGTISTTFTCLNWVGGALSLTSAGVLTGGTFSAGTLVGVITEVQPTTLTNNGTVTVSAGTMTATGAITAGVLTADGTITRIINGGRIGASGTIANAAGFNNVIGAVVNSGSAGRIGAISNTGTITTTGSVAVTGALPTGSVQNVVAGIANMAGTISTISNSGLISLTATVQNDDSALGAIANRGVIETLTNQAGGRLTAAITGFNGSAAGVFNSDLGTIGTLQNDAGATISGQYAVLNRGVINTLLNNGTISAYSGVVTRAGTIGNLTNNGSITATDRNGVYAETGSTIVSLLNSATGIISAGSTGVRNNGNIGTLTNVGTIVGNYAGIVVDSAGTVGTINNSGSLSGFWYGIINDGSIGTLNNSGTMQSDGTVVLLETTGSLANLVNTGLIAGEIRNETTNNMTITGGTGTVVGTFTGSSGGLGSLDKGTITSTSADLVFASGNILLNDNLNMTGRTLTNSANLTLANPIALVGYFRMAGGTLSGGTLVGSTAYILQSGVISSVLGGSVGFGKSTTGTVTLSGANTFTGAASITAGVLAITNGASLGTTGQGTSVSSGATLQMSGGIAVGAEALSLSGSGASGATGALQSVSGANSYAGTITLGASSTIAVDADTLTLSGTLAGGAYTLSVAGAGTLVITGSASAGQTSIASGATVQIGNGGTTGSLSGAIVNDGTLAFNRSVSTTYSGVISGSGGLTKLGTNALYLTGDNTYTGTTTVSAGTLYIGQGGTTGSIAGDVVNNSGLGFFRSDTVTYGGAISGTGQTGVGGGGTLVFTGAATNTGGTWVSNATLQIGNGGTTGSIAGNIATEFSGIAGALVFNRSDDITFAGVISGSGTLTKQGAGVLTLTGANTVTGGTTISAGTLQIGNGGTTGSLTGAIANSGTLVFNSSDAVSAGSITGTGSLIQRGIGTLTLTGTNSASDTTVEAGTLALQTGAQLSSDVLVQSGATLAGVSTGAGTAQVNGVVTVANGGHISASPVGGSNYGLSVTNLVLNSTSNVDVALGGNVGAAAIHAQTLTLDGTLNVTNTGGMTFGVYRIIDYDTLVADNGLTLGSVPFGFDGVIQTSVANQVNLVVDAYSLFWNGSTTTADGTIHGGSGIWSSGGATNWTNAAGAVAGSWSGGIAIFQGTPGTVTVDTGGGAVNVSALQFAVDGYEVTGGTLTLTGAGQTGVRVGDGTSAGASYIATISSALAGTSGLNKQDLGTLVLTGTNTYTGGTTVTAGTLQIGDGVSTGSILGDVVNNANLVFNPGSALTYSGAISGTGSLFKQGSGTLTLRGTNTYSGGTSITGGRLIISGGSSLSDTDGLIIGAAGTLELLDANETVGWLSGAGAVALNANCLTVAGGGTTFSGSISGSGCVNKTGTGTLTLSGTSTYSGGTSVSGGAVQVTSAAALGTGGLALHGAGTLQASGTFTYGDAVTLWLSGGTGGGTFQVDDTQTLTLSGIVSGAGSLSKTGTGTLVLSGTNAYDGATNVTAGTLIASGGHAISDIGLVNVASGATFVLQGNETIGSLSGAGSVQLDGASLTLGGDNTSTTYSGVMSGTGGLTKTGTGTLTLSGVNTYAGDTTVAASGLVLSGSVAGDVTVQNLATLSGGGSVAGAVTVQNGGTLSGSQTSGLTMGGLDLAASATLAVTLGAPSVASGVFTVNGDVVLDGTLAVTPSTGFGIGVYRIINYTGTLTDNGLDVTGVPTGMSGGVQTAVLNEVNLFIEDPSSPITFWNGTSTTPTQVIQGGSGTWAADAQTNWTNASATVAKSWNSGFAVFQGTAGTVTVDNTSGQVATSGMQFVTSGYVVAGGALELSATGGPATIRVGDGTSASATTVATIESVLMGTGGLEKADFGTLILTGANTYTGGTTISGGTLQIGDGGTSGAILGDVVDNGALVFDRSDAVTFAGVISGTGSVAQAGTGTLSLTGANTYSGGTSITTGTLQVASASALGTGGLTLSNGGTLWASGSFTFGGSVVLGTPSSFSRAAVSGGTVQVDPSQTVVLSGTVSGDGALSKTGTGTLTLAGANSYTGGTTVSAGTLVLGTSTAAGTGQISMLAGTTLSYASGIDVANTLDVTGVVELTVASGSAVQTGAVTGTGTYIITGAGSLNLLSTSSFSGTTSVDGTLSVNGSLGGTVTVTSGGTLKGNGTVGTTTVLAGGTVAPGNSIGTLTVSGNLTFNAGSLYQVEVDAAGSSDRIITTGTATISGGTVQVLAATGTYAPETTYTILTAAGGVSGTFSTVTSNLAYLTPSLGYDASSVYLTLARNNQDFCLPGFSGNQCRTATAVQDLGTANTLYNAVVSLDAATAGVAFDQLSGQIYASAQAAALQDSHFTRDAAFDRLRSASGSVGATATSMVASYADAPPLGLGKPGAPLPGTTTELWMQGFGAWGDFAAGTGTAQLDRTIGGVYAGVDRLVLDGWRLGALAGYSRSTLKVDALNSSLTSDNYTFGLYAGQQWDALGLRLGAAYTWHDINANRSVAFTGFSEQLNAGTSASTMQLFGELGYRMRVGGIDVEPFANLAYVKYESDAFIEAGGAAALSVAAQNADTTFGTLGLRVAAPVFSNASTVINARGMIGWKYAFDMPTSSASMAFAGGNPFSVTGVPLAQNAAVLEAGFDTLLATDTTLSLSYSGQFGDGFTDNAVQAALSWRF